MDDLTMAEPLRGLWWRLRDWLRHRRLQGEYLAERNGSRAARLRREYTVEMAQRRAVRAAIKGGGRG